MTYGHGIILKMALKNIFTVIFGIFILSILFYAKFPIEETVVPFEKEKKETIKHATSTEIITEPSEKEEKSTPKVVIHKKVPIVKTPEVAIQKASEIKIPEKLTPLPISKYAPIWDSGIFDQSQEEELWRAGVKLECLHADKKATSLGSGIVLTKDGVIATNFHVVQNVDTCKVIFPSSGTFNGNVIRPVYYLSGKITKKADNGENYDIALLQMDPISSFTIDPAYNWKGNPYPFISYPVCATSELGDKVIHYGWDSRSDEGNIMDRTKGAVREFIWYSESEDELYYDGDEKSLYVWTDAHTNPGVSGGLSFNATRDCIFGLSSRVGGEQGSYRTWILNFVNPVIKGFLGKS